MEYQAVHAWAPPAQEEIFIVHFGAGGVFGLGAKPVDTLGWVGEAKLHIGPGGLFLEGKGRSGQALQKRLSYDEIRNAHGWGTVIRFDMPPETPGVPRFVQFDTKAQVNAARVLQLLPPTHTPEFRASMIELNDFRARLTACSGPPRVTPVLVAINVLVFVAMLVDGAGLMQLNPEVHLRWGSSFGPLTVDGQWWRLLTSAFIHFGLIHLAFNMYALWDLGGVIERLYGRWRFLCLYLFSALTSGLASIWWHTEPVNSAGASGAIFGLFGGMLAFAINPRNRVPRAIMVAHRNTVLIWGGYSLLFGAANAGIDNAAHVGGLIGGFAIGWLLARPVDPQVRAQPGGKQLAAALLGAVLILGAGFWAVLHPSVEAAQVRAFESFQMKFSGRESAAVEQMKRGFEMGKAGNLAGFRAQMAGAARQWSAIEDELRGIELGSVEDVHRREAFLRYVDARRRYCELWAAYSEGGDTAPMQAVEREVAAALAELNGKPQ